MVAEEIGFPLDLEYSFVLGGWHRTAESEDELRKLLSEGLALSPVNEVVLTRG